MAGLKKNRRTKDASSPNIVLVLFLIFFIITSLVLGLLIYFGQEQQNKALADAATAKKVQQADKDTIALYQTMTDVQRQALGQDLNQDEMARLDTNLKDLLGENSRLGKFDE